MPLERPLGEGEERIAATMCVGAGDALPGIRAVAYVSHGAQAPRPLALARHRLIYNHIANGQLARRRERDKKRHVTVNATRRCHVASSSIK